MIKRPQARSGLRGDAHRGGHARTRRGSRTIGAPGERALPRDGAAFETAPARLRPGDSESTGVMAHDIPVANPASETTGEPASRVDECPRSSGPESETRGGLQAPEETLDAPRRAGEKSRTIAASDPPVPPGQPPELPDPDPDKPSPIQEPPPPIPVPPNDPPPPIVAVSNASTRIAMWARCISSGQWERNNPGCCGAMQRGAVAQGIARLPDASDRFWGGVAFWKQPIVSDRGVEMPPDRIARDRRSGRWPDQAADKRPILSGPARNDPDAGRRWSRGPPRCS